MHRHRFIFFALLALTVGRWALTFTLDLAPIEALAVEAGRHSGWTWAEIGPLMGWLVKVSTGLFGESEFGVRFFAPLLALITSLAVWRLAHEMLDRQTAAWSVVMLNVLPAFNLAAVFLTPGSVSFAGYTILALLVHRTLQGAGYRAWIAAALCVAALIWADWRNAVVLLSLILGLALSGKGRSHWLRLSWLCLGGVGGFSILAWARWCSAHGWHLGYGGDWSPEWTVIANVFRWILLISPLLSGLLIGQFSAVAIEIRRRGVSSLGLLLGMSLPLAVIDFAWGVWRPWADAGLAVWSAFAVILLFHRAQQEGEVHMQSKVIARTSIVVLAGLQSLVLLRTDIIRDLGIPWPFSQDISDAKTYRRFLKADPTGAMHGWRETGALVSEVVSAPSAKKGRWFLVADDWRLAAELGFYLPAQTSVLRPTLDHPRVHVYQGDGRVGPFEHWPRYDGDTGNKEGFAGAHALFITDDSRVKQPPAAWLRAFSSWQIVSIAEVKHGGHLVRTIKIFACHGYRPPDF